MTQDKWSKEEMAAGYAAMAELNLAIAAEFAALEDEADAVISEQQKNA